MGGGCSLDGGRAGGAPCKVFPATYARNRGTARPAPDSRRIPRGNTRQPRQMPDRRIVDHREGKPQGTAACIQPSPPRDSSYLQAGALPRTIIQKRRNRTSERTELCPAAALLIWTFAFGHPWRWDCLVSQ